MPLLIGKSFFFYFASVAVAYLVRPRMGIYTSQICYKTKTKIRSLKRSFETCIIFSQFFIIRTSKLLVKKKLFLSCSTTCIEAFGLLVFGS